MKKKEKVLICRKGRQAAGLSKVKVKKRRNRLALNPSLQVRLRYNPVEPLTENEFPAQFR